MVYIAIMISLLAGVTNVLSRTMNAELAIHTSLRKSTFMNFLVGLIVAILVLLAVDGGPTLSLPEGTAIQPWIYTGGLIGVAVVMISNATVSKISSFSMTLLVFVGQVFTGILLDMLISGVFSWKTLVGGLCVAAGLTINVIIDKKYHL